jgi:hypothetical protein
LLKVLNVSVERKTMEHLLAMSAIDIFKAEELLPAAVHDKQNCSFDSDSVPSCFLYDAEALIIGAMAREHGLSKKAKSNYTRLGDVLLTRCNRMRGVGPPKASGISEHIVNSVT